MKSSPPEGLQVLVVDDDSALIRTLSDILRIHGYSTDTAATGREGLLMARDHPPALAVIDLRLPDMDGMELVSRLHELSELTEVVVLTGNASVESAIAALREHSVDYLLKPVQVEHLLQVVSVATERWQRRTAEIALKESEERYRMLFDSNPQPVWVFDRETLRFLAVNDAAVRHYGYRRDEFLAMTIETIRPAEDVPAMLRSAKAPSRGDPRVWRHMKKDGTLIAVEITTHDIDFAGRPARIVLAADVTERVAAESAARARARQQAAVASFGQRAIAADDVTELIRDAAGLVATTLELPVVSILERRSDGASLVLSAGHGWAAASIGQIVIPIGDESQAGYTLSRGEPVIIADLQSDERFPRSHALRVRGARSGMTVVIPGPIHPFGVLAAHDTERRTFTQDDVHFLQAVAHIVGTTIERGRTEVVLRQGQRLEAVGRLAGGVAHDFNNMLTAITGYAELLRMHEGDAEAVREDIDEILKAANRAAGLTRQLLAFSRQQVLQPRIVDLNAVVANMEGMLRRLITADIEFVTALDGDIGMVRADPGQIEQVILNLCVNARDAMPEGGTLTVETANVELDLSHTLEHSIDGQGQYVMLAVSDTGIGMDADTKARIYEPFFTTKATDKGTGLGLPTVYGIVKQTGGEIWVYSEVGRGTTFKVFLPFADGAPDAPPAAARQHTRSGGGETILLAEDEDAVRRLARRVLETAGYTVLLASGGDEAEGVSASHEGRIHLLVTDMVMPNMSGPELAGRLRATRPGIGVLYLSGYTDAAVARNGLLDDGENFLQKPFTSEALRRKVREALDAQVAV